MIPALAHFAIRQFGKLFRLPGVHRGVSDGYDNASQMRSLGVVFRRFHMKNSFLSFTAIIPIGLFIHGPRLAARNHAESKRG